MTFQRSLQVFGINYAVKRSDYLIAESRIEQLEMELKLKNEAFETKEAAWKSKV